MPVDIPIVGDIRQVLCALTEEVENNVPQEWLDCTLEYKNSYPARGEPQEHSVEPRVFIRDLSAMMEENAILVADVGENQIWCARNFNVKEGRFLTSGGLGTMGYSVPAAIGAKLAKPHRQVVAVCGDGSFQMSMCELGTLCQEGVAVKIIVMENGVLGMVKEFQDRLYGRRHMATVLNGNPDFCAAGAGLRHPGGARGIERAGQRAGPPHARRAGAVPARVPGGPGSPEHLRKEDAAHEIHAFRTGGKPARRPFQGFRAVRPARLQH